MFTRSFFSLLLLSGTLFVQPALAQHGKQSNSKLADEVLHYVNEHRANIRLKPLVMTEPITEAAEKHSRNMAANRIPFGHEGFDGRMAKLRKQLQPVNGWAENVAAGDLSAKEVVNMWLHSPGHKKNMEGNYNLTGIGIVKSSNGELYFTQIFISKKN